MGEICFFQTTKVILYTLHNFSVWAKINFAAMGFKITPPNINQDIKIPKNILQWPGIKPGSTHGLQVHPWRAPMISLLKHLYILLQYTLINNCRNTVYCTIDSNIIHSSLLEFTWFFCIAAFQAVDPGLIPGWRKFYVGNYFLKLIQIEQDLIIL